MIIVFIDSSSTRSRPPTAGLYLFSDFHESLLDKLDHPGPGIGVDPDPREQILIPPVVDSRGRAAELDVHAPAHEARDHLLVGVAGPDVAFGVVGRVVQRDVARVGVEDRDDLRCRAPVRDVARDAPFTGGLTTTTIIWRVVSWSVPICACPGQRSS